MSLCLVAVFHGGIPLNALAGISGKTCSCLPVENKCWPTFKVLKSDLCAPTMISSDKLFFPESDLQTNPSIFFLRKTANKDRLAAFIVHKQSLASCLTRPLCCRPWHSKPRFSIRPVQTSLKGSFQVYCLFRITTQKPHGTAGGKPGFALGVSDAHRHAKGQWCLKLSPRLLKPSVHSTQDSPTLSSPAGHFTMGHELDSWCYYSQPRVHWLNHSRDFTHTVSWMLMDALKAAPDVRKSGSWDPDDPGSHSGSAISLPVQQQTQLCLAWKRVFLPGLFPIKSMWWYR